MKKNGREITNRDEVLKVMTEFYTTFYANVDSQNQNQTVNDKEEEEYEFFLTVVPSEVKEAIN